MGFLRKLFTGNEPVDKDGIYLYIQSDRTGEVIPLRIHRYNDLSRTEDESFFVRKTVVGTKSFDRIECEFTFDRGRNLSSAEIDGGELVAEDDYKAWQTEQGLDVE